MASPRSTATFATANSQFEVEDTSIQNISIATIPEAELPKDHKDLICDISNDTREQQVEQRWGLLPEVTPTQTIITTHEELIPEVDTLRKDIDWNTTGTIKQETPRTYEQITKSRAKEQYYREAFAGREAPNFSRQRLIKTSVLIAEIKTNIVIQDEFNFLTTMSAFLAARYNRPESSIMLTANHSTCMLFGGSFEPTYLLTISAISEQIKPTMNRRNTALIQRFLAEELMVPSERGIIKFQAIPEENLANCGITLAAEIDQDTKASIIIPSSTSSLSETFSLSRRLNSSKKNRISTRISQTKPSNLPTPPGTPPHGAGLALLTIQSVHNRSTSDTTTFSNPDMDRLLLSQSNTGYNNDTQKTLKSLGGKKSRFFRKLIA